MRLNVITVHLRFENKINPPALPFGAPSAGTRINLPAVTAQCYNWLSCHYLDGRSGGSLLRFPLADGSATVVFLTSMNWLKKKKKKERGRESQEVLSYWHSNSIPQKLSTRFSELLSQKTSELNKINAPPLARPPPRQPVSLEKQCVSLSEEQEKRNACVVSISFSHTRWLPHFCRITLMCHEG